MTDLHETDVHRAARARFIAIRDQLGPQMARRAEAEPDFRDPEICNLQVAQNVLRECMEAILKEMIPFTSVTSAELAIRMASYAVSISPLEEQPEVMRAVLHSLPVAHRSRLNKGVMIRSQWYMPAGSSEPLRQGPADA